MVICKMQTINRLMAMRGRPVCHSQLANTVDESRVTRSSTVRMHGIRPQGGFTLIELMVVVVIAAILASVAVPSYENFIARSKRSQAKSMLLQVADKQEQFFLDNKRYAATMTELGYAANPFYIDGSSTQQASASADSIYRLEFSVTTNTTYSAAAAPLGAQASNDSKCGTLSLDNTGRRDQSGPATDCW